MNKWEGYKFNKNTLINRSRSTNPLAKLSYKELQKAAFHLHLPGNLQHKVLLAVVMAKQQDRDDIVSIILKTHRTKKKCRAQNLGNATRETQQLPSTNYSRSESKSESNYFVAASKSASSNLKNYFRTAIPDESTPLTNISDEFTLSQEHQPHSTITSFNESQSHSTNAISESASSNLENYFSMEILDDPMSSKDCYSSGNTSIAVPLHSDVTNVLANNVDNIEPLLTTPSLSFESDVSSFTGLDKLLEDSELLHFENLLNDDNMFEIGATEGSAVMDSTEISLVDVLETLAENQ